MKKCLSYVLSLLVILTICMIPMSVMPAASAAVTYPLTVENFETYPNNDDLNNYGNDKASYRHGYFPNPYGGKANWELDSKNKYEGKYGLRFSYDFTIQEDTREKYAGRHSFLPILSDDPLAFVSDWSGGDAVQFWFKGDSSENTFVIHLDISDGSAWNSRTFINSSEPQFIRIPWSGFYVDKEHTGMSLDLTQVSQIAIYVNKNLPKDIGPVTGKKDTGTVYIDYLQIVRNSDPIPELKSTNSTTSKASSKASGAASTTNSNKTSTASGSANASKSSTTVTASNGTQQTESTASVYVPSADAKELVDTATGVEVKGELPEDANLNVAAVEEAEDVYKNALEKLSDIAEKMTMLNIGLINAENAAIQPNGQVQISVPKPAGYGDDIAVYFTAADGTSTRIASRVEGDNIIFSHDGTGYFTIVELKAGADPGSVAAVDPDETDAGSSMGIIIAVVIAVVVIAAGVLIYLFVIKPKSAAKE